MRILNILSGLAVLLTTLAFALYFTTTIDTLATLRIPLHSWLECYSV